MKRITITIIVLVTVCCLLVGCTPNEENSAETYTLPALETGEHGETAGTPETGASEPGNAGTVSTDHPTAAEQANTSGSSNPDNSSPAGSAEHANPGNTDQPPVVTTDSSEVHTVDDSEENLTPRDSDPIHEENDSSEDIPMTETPVQVPIDTEDPDMIVESDYVYEPSGNVGIGGN